MNDELPIAFKEWAVIIKALAEGRQTLILRKGGIAEDEGEFRVEHERFWLYPTYTHQQAEGLRADWRELLTPVESTRPQLLQVLLGHWVEVSGVYQVRELEMLLRLAPLHGWSEATIRQRFAYRQPGLLVLTVRVHAAPTVTTIVEDADYLGCKSWVPLKSALTTSGSRLILEEREYEKREAEVSALLNPGG